MSLVNFWTFFLKCKRSNSAIYLLNHKYNRSRILSPSPVKVCFSPLPLSFKGNSAIGTDPLRGNNLVKPLGLGPPKNIFRISS